MCSADKWGDWGGGREMRETEMYHLKNQKGWVWWYMPIILALRRFRQEDSGKYEGSLGYKANLKAAWTETLSQQRNKQQTNGGGVTKIGRYYYKNNAINELIKTVHRWWTHGLKKKSVKTIKTMHVPKYSLKKSEMQRKIKKNLTTGNRKVTGRSKKL